MCGIFAIVFNRSRSDLGSILYKAATRLLYRGYDSVGFATLDAQDKVDLRKDKGKLDDVNRELHLSQMQGVRGMVQLRWATFGAPSKKNSQPHRGCRGKMISAHNGNIVNTTELIDDLTAKGHLFQGDNDGEALCHRVEESRETTATLEEAVREGHRFIQGHYSAVFAEEGDPRMVAVKAGSSLFLGQGDGFVCISSDLPSILEFTRTYVPLKDGEMVIFDSQSFSLRSLQGGEPILRPLQTYTEEITVAEKGAFPHFMLKEIHDQPEGALELQRFAFSSKEYRQRAQRLLKHPRIFLIGSGSSYHAALMGEYALKNTLGLDVNACVAGEFIGRYGAVLKPEDGFLFISQSGETKDLLLVVDFVEKRGLKNLYSLVNVTGSTLHTRLPERFPILSHQEVGVAATKTFFNQALTFLILAEAAGAPIRGSIESLHDLLKEQLRIFSESVPPLARSLTSARALFFLGYGVSHPAVLEAALKVKELAYTPSEGFFSSEFKHGPLAMIEEGQPVFFLSTLGDKELTVAHINEIKVRGGIIHTVSPEDSLLRKNSHALYPLETEDPLLVPLMGVLFFQLLAYHMAVAAGENPDTPRNLSKSITVD